MTDLRKVPALLTLALLAACSSATSSPAVTTPPAAASLTPSDTPTSTPTSTDSASDSGSATPPTDATSAFALPTDLLSGLPTSLPSLGDGKGCEKLTAADVSAAAGFEVKAPQSQAVGPIVQCIFIGPAGEAVLVRLERGVGAVGWSTTKTVLEAAGQKAASVPGLGDEAYSVGVAGTYTVGVRKGNGDVVVTLGGASVTREQAIAVAKLALSAAGL